MTCEVIAVQENGIEVKIADSDLTTFIKRFDLSRDRSEQRAERLTVGQKVDGSVISADKAARRISVSIKALVIAEEKQASGINTVRRDSGASLGDIFKAPPSRSAPTRKAKARARATRSKGSSAKADEAWKRGAEAPCALFFPVPPAERRERSPLRRARLAPVS